MATTQPTLVDESRPSSEKPWSIEVFYDGDCPLCMREIVLLKRWDRNDRIRFTDIAATDFNAADYGISHADFMSEIRGRLPNGDWIQGVEVFRRLYSAVGFSPIVAATRLPGISHGLELGYRVFAKNRLRLTGRCDATSGCKVN